MRKLFNNGNWVRRVYEALILTVAVLIGVSVWVSNVQSQDQYRTAAIRYVTTLPDFGQFPGELVVLTGTGAADPLLQIWNANDDAWEHVAGDASGLTPNDLTPGNQIILPRGTSANPTIIFSGDDDGSGTGIFSESADVINMVANGATTASFRVGGMFITNGTAASPAIKFTDDTDLGMYRVGANDLGFATNGAIRANLNSTGLTVVGEYAIGSASITEAELETIDGVTVGTAAASKVLTLDSSSYLGGMSVLQHTVKTLTQNQLENLAATPVEVIAAPGVNLYIHVISWRFFLDFVSTAFDDAAADGNLVLEYATGDDIGASMEADALIDAGADFMSYKPITETGPISAAIPSNDAVDITNDGAEFTVVGGGNSLGEVEVFYVIVRTNPTQ